MNILAQFFGIIAFIIMILSIQIKNKKALYLLVNIIVCLLFTASYILLDAIAGAVVSIIDIVITFISYLYNRKDKDVSKYWAPIFIVINLIAGVFTYENIYSLLATICGVIYSILVVSKNMKEVRRLNLTQCILWTVYDGIMGAYGNVIASIFNLISTVIGIIRHDRKENKQEIVET